MISLTPTAGDWECCSESGRTQRLNGAGFNRRAAVPPNHVPIVGLLICILLAQKQEVLAVGRPDRIARARQMGQDFARRSAFGRDDENTPERAWNAPGDHRCRESRPVGNPTSV